MMVTTV